jgi:hypothetical protein
MNEGLGLLLDGHPGDAEAAFKRIADAGLYARSGPELKLADFLDQASRLMAGHGSVPAAYQQNFQPDTHEAFAFLLFALKDWNESDFDDAATFLDAYAASTVKPPYDWIAEYKPLAANYAADSKTVVTITNMAAKARTSAEKSAALDALRKARIELKIGGKANEALLKTDYELQRGASDAKADEERKATEQKQADTKVVGDAGQRFATLCAEYRFAEARAEVEKITASDPAAARNRDAMLQKAGWLLDFQKRLISDINQSGSSVPVTLKSSQALRDGISHATDKTIQARSQYGAAEVPWGNVSAASVFALAQDFIRRMPADPQTTERKWLAGVFATIVANSPEGRAFLVEASQSRDEYRDKLLVIFPAAE